MQKMLSLKAVIERNLRETTGKIESEMKEVKDKLASLTAAVEKCIGQLLETEKKWVITCISSQAHWAEIVVWASDLSGSILRDFKSTNKRRGLCTERSP